jgi:oxygen-dependent protoporphyrinogen oxidase
LRIVLLGGGISGLSAAWYARQKYPHAHITLLEKSSRLGGCLQTVQEAGFLFERGPRTFQLSRSPQLLHLICEMGLKDELIFSGKKGARRYLWERGKLRSMGSFLPQLLFPLLRESQIPPSSLEDESIYDFASRRFSPQIAETLFDPMTLGIYGGDFRKLSIKSCFPKLFAWEREKGSCFRGLLSSLLQRAPSTLFTLKRGMESLVQTLAQKIDAEVILQCEVETVESTGVFAQGKSFDADLIFSCLPASVIASLTNISFPIQEIPLSVLSCCYEQKISLPQGFGYLIPSKEKEPLLGMIWDSSIFPEQNSGKTCFTAMMRQEDPLALQEALTRHLSLSIPPSHISSYTAQRAIPQFEVGYDKLLLQFKKNIDKKFPSIRLLGNYLQGPSVESCVTIARNSV